MKLTSLSILLSALATAQAATRKAGTHCDDFSSGTMTCSPDHRRLLACGAGPCKKANDNNNHLCWGTVTDCGQQAMRCFQDGDINDTPPYCQQYGNYYNNGGGYNNNGGNGYYDGNNYDGNYNNGGYYNGNGYYK